MYNDQCSLELLWSSFDNNTNTESLCCIPQNNINVICQLYQLFQKKDTHTHTLYIYIHPRAAMLNSFFTLISLEGLKIENSQELLRGLYLSMLTISKILNSEVF